MCKTTERRRPSDRVPPGFDIFFKESADILLNSTVRQPSQKLSEAFATNGNSSQTRCKCATPDRTSLKRKSSPHEQQKVGMQSSNQAVPPSLRFGQKGRRHADCVSRSFSSRIRGEESFAVSVIFALSFLS